VIRFLFILGLLTMHSRSDAQSCFARVQLDRKSVYVQQPFKVTITVLTATWYTAPIEFDNLQVPNAFVLPFDKTMPGMFDHNGKQYAGIQFYFIVFPYKAGSFTIPAITVHATTPPEGSGESRRITISTPVQHFTVKGVPANVEGNWFVAKSATIHERWNKSLSNLKVGDVIERTVTIHARGTLPQFIPALSERELAFANVYPHDPELKDTRDEHDANGELTQSFTYLLEKEGEFVIPPMPLQWWSSTAGKLEKRSLPQHRIHVNTNPDLGMVASIKDSLDVAQQNVPSDKAEKGAYKIYGIIWYWFAIYVLVALVVFYAIVRASIRIVRSAQKRYGLYKLSEKYWFRKLMHATGSWPEFWRGMYHWWDRLDTTNRTTSIQETAIQYDNKELETILQSGNESLYQNKQNKRIDQRAKNNMRKFRKWLRGYTIHEEKELNDRQRPW